MSDFAWKQNDTWPPLPAQLSDANGPVDLTTAVTVTLHLKSQGAGTTLGGGVCVITDAAAGRVTYTPTTADTDVVTQYNGEFEVDWGGGKTSTFPNGSTSGEEYITVQIVAELDA